MAIGNYQEKLKKIIIVLAQMTKDQKKTVKRIANNPTSDFDVSVEEIIKDNQGDKLKRLEASYEKIKSKLTENA